jgi:DNA-binding NarL/FixJ family response regulator
MRPWCCLIFSLAARESLSPSRPLSIQSCSWFYGGMLSKISVLIVDDHESFRRTLRSRFESLPAFTVCGEATDGVEAIEKAQQLSPHLVILDFAMPGMNGLETAMALKCMMPSVRLFLLTVHSTREIELAAREVGVSGVFSKYDNLTALFRQAVIDCILEEVAPGTKSEYPAAQIARRNL